MRAAILSPSPPRLALVWRLAAAPIAVLLAFLVQLELLPRPHVAPFVFFFVGVALASWLGGLAPGLASVVLSAAAANYFFMDTRPGWSSSEVELRATALFGVAASVVAFICASLRQSIVRVRDAAGALQEHGQILELSHDAMIIWTFGGGIETWNRGAEELYGFTASEARGQSSHALLKTRSPGPLLEIDAELRRRGRWEGELEHAAKDGRTVVVSAKLQRIVIDGVEKVLESNRDITGSKQAEGELRRLSTELRERVGELQTLLEIAPVAIWITRDAEGKTITGNAYADELIMRVSRGSNVSATAEPGQAAVRYRVTHDGIEVPGPELPSQRAAASGRPVPVEEQELVFEDGRRVQLLVGASPLFDAQGKVRGSVATGIDVGRMKEMEEALREADHRKTEFLAMLSHELRNPLAPITNSLYVLEHAAPGGEQARRAQEVIGRQVGQLVRMVDDLLEVTRITRGKIRLQQQRLDLDELVRRTLEDHRSLFDAAGVRLALEPSAEPVFVNADQNRIAQVLGNLLGNAARFTPRGGRVTVAVGVEAGDEWARLRVADDGVGIAAEVLPRLFTPFIQADTTLDRSKGGLGLGLALVRGLVEQHGGTITAHSDGVGRGSEFTVRLPLLERVRAETPPRRPARAIGRHRVLVIEDNVDAADSLRELLELEGQCVAVAYDGRDGIAQAHGFRPELVLCDVGLPEMNGYEVARAIRTQPSLRDTRLVALSGYALPEDVERAAAAGFESHLAKPPSVALLREVLATLEQ